MSFADENVPSLLEFRNAVNKISNKRDSLLVKVLYLLAARVSEVLTKCTPYDLSHNQTKAYGSHLRWKLTDWDAKVAKGDAKARMQNKVLLLKMAVAKRSSKDLAFKVIALPLNLNFEPWTLDLCKYIRKQGELRFPLTRHRVRQILKERLGEGIFKKKTSDKRLLNPLRHYRITHLAEYYDFDAYDLTVYAGWTFRTGFGKIGMSSGQLDSYLHLGWRRYYPKLLKPIAMLV